LQFTYTIGDAARHVSTEGVAGCFHPQAKYPIIL